MSRALTIDGKRLRDLRIERGWTQTKLAQMAGVSPRTISHCEHGRATTAQTAARIAEALQISLNNLLIADVFAIPLSLLVDSDVDRDLLAEVLTELAVLYGELSGGDELIIREGKVLAPEEALA